MIRVARDINGTALENAPFEQVFHHKDSNSRFQRHLPIQGEFRLRDHADVSPIVLEWCGCSRPCAVLRSAPRQV